MSRRRPREEEDGEVSKKQRTSIINDSNIYRFVRAYVNDGQRSSVLPDELRNKPIGEWDVSKVTNMSNLFESESYFNEFGRGWNMITVH